MYLDINATIETLETIKDLEFKELNAAQKDWIRSKNMSASGIKYAINKEDDSLVILCSESTFKSLEYYGALEYAKSSIVLFVKVDNDILVEYVNDCDRIGGFIENLQERK
jgi:hypothetical protein